MKAKFWGVFLACFLAFCAVPVGAFAGSISGTVHDATTGEPMGGVTACALSAGGGTGSCVGVPASGEYTIEGLPTDQYRVFFQPEPDTNYVHQYFAGTPYFWAASLLPLDGSGQMVEVDAWMEEGATVSGTVVGEGDLGPVDEAEVCAEDLSFGGYTYCEHTDSAGSYQITGLPASSYRIYFQRGGSDVNYATQYYDGKSFEGEADEVELEAGEQFTADATLVRSGAIEGVVTEDGSPIAWPSVCVYTLDETAVACGGGEEDGSYYYGGLPPGQYVLELEESGHAPLYSGGAATFAEATPVTVAPGDTATEDFELHGPSGISGTVRDATTGEAPTGTVNACASSDSGTWCWRINADGTYKMTGLDPGPYLVYFEGPNYLTQYYDGVSEEKDATLVTVGDVMVSHVDAELQAAGTLTGKVTAAGTGAFLSVETCLLDQAGTVLSCGSSSSKTGSYRFESVAPGQYKVRFKKSGYGTQYFDGKTTVAAADSVTVTGLQATAEIDATMVVAPANTVKPSLSGVGKVGEVLSCSQGTWSGSPTSYAYFWRRGSETIGGAEASTYTVAAADAGKSLRCGVTADAGLGGRVSAESSNSLSIPAARQLSVVKAGSGAGTVVGSPAGIDCGATCAVGAYQGDRFTLTATPAPHSEFTGWSGAGCTGAGTCEVTLGGADATVTATFAKVTHAVAVTVSGAGSVTADAGAIAGCTEVDGTCSGTYDEGSEVTLVATPDAHHQLTGWTGCTVEAGAECTVTVEAAAAVTASFAPVVHRLTVTRSGAGAGSVTSDPAGIDCGATCAGGFDEGTAITLTAAAGDGSKFTGWSGGGCTGTGSCVVSLGEDATVVAGFAPKSSDGGGTDAGADQPPASDPPASSNAQGPSLTAPSTAPLPGPVTKKPLQCKKGFHKVKRKGKARCVKAKPKKAKGKGKRS